MNAESSGRALVGALAAIIASVGCGEPASDAIEDQLRSGALAVTLGEVAGSDWDRLFVFGPYSGAKHICSALALSESECAHARLRDVGAGYSLVVFMEGRLPSYHEEIPRRTANFDVGCLGRPIARPTTRFVVEQRPGGTYLACRT